MTLTFTQTQAHPDPIIQEASLSDLFFNYDHPAFAAFMTNDAEGNDSDGREELLKDAAEFVDVLDRATGMKLNAAELVEEYFSRQ